MASILYAATNFVVPTNGAAKSNLAFLHALQKAGHDVNVLYSVGNAPRGVEKTIQGIPAVRVGRDGLERAVAGRKPDLLITQGYGVESIPSSASCPVIFQFRQPYTHVCDRSLTCPENDNFWRRWDICRISCVESNKKLRKNRRCLERVTTIVSNSAWSRDLALKFFNRDSVVIHPPCPRPQGDLSRTDNLIVFLGRSNRKGLAFFCRIAQKMPDRRFGVIGMAKVPGAPENVECLGWRRDEAGMVAACRRAWLAVCPDQEPPAFNRTPRELSHFGVPVVASNLGGLPDAVGAGGILVDRHDDESAFAEAIIKMSDIRLYNAFSSAQDQIAQVADTSNEFVALVESLL